MDAADWDARYAAAELVWSAEPNRWVAEVLAALPPGRALDLAAGEGRNAIWLASRGWQVTAVDFSRVAIDKAAALAARQGVALDLVVADVTEWTPPAAAFDAVVIAYLQLPREPMAAVLRSAATAVAPGGTLLVVGHDRDNLDRGHGGPQDPEVLLTVPDVCAALDGLEIVRAEQVLRPVPLPDGDEATAIDTLVQAVAPAGLGGSEREEGPERAGRGGSGCAPTRERDALLLRELSRSDLPPDDVVRDDLLRLIFTCCHPTLSPPSTPACPATRPPTGRRCCASTTCWCRSPRLRRAWVGRSRPPRRTARAPASCCSTSCRPAPAGTPSAPSCWLARAASPRRLTRSPGR
ncbi:MAG TPA: methyltransferase domain-containing protein [Egibacteraceae bacterium]